MRARCRTIDHESKTSDLSIVVEGSQMATSLVKKKECLATFLFLFEALLTLGQRSALLFARFRVRGVLDAGGHRPPKKSL